MYKKMPDNFICGKCGKVAKTKQALERHAAYHEDDRPFSCEVCLQRFKNSDDRGKHYRRLKRDGKFNIACTVCHKHFKTDDILSKHIEMLGCNVAAVDETVTSKSEPTGHNIQEGSAITLKEEYVIGDCIACTCKVCENVFSSTSSLKKHYKEVHNDNKRQVCIQCGQTLSSKDSLARHFSIFHQSSFPYACDLCDQKFKIKESLCRHVKFVHQDGGYQCHECHRVFSQPVNLRKHSAVHTTQKQFTCKSCGREFRWKQAMQKHELLHEPQGLSSKEDKKVNSSNCIKEDLNGPGERIGETHIDLEDEETLDNSYEVFNNIHSNTDSPKDSAQGNVIEDKTRCDLNSTNQSTKVKKNENSVKCSVKKLPTLPDSSEYSLGNNDTVKKGRESRWSEGDEYDFPDSDEESGFNDNFSREECRKRVGFSNVMKCIKSKKLKLVDINTRPKEKTFSRVSGYEKISKEDDNSSLRDKSFSEDVVCERTSKQVNGTYENVEINNAKVTDSKSDESFTETSYDMVESRNSLTDIPTEHEEPEEQNIENFSYGEKRKSDLEHSEQSSEFNNDVGIKKFKLAALTSFPTDKTKDAPELLFKPSSIQTIMSGPTKEQPSSSYTAEDKTDEAESRVDNRKSGMRLPSVFSSMYTKLHNPFIIPNSRLQNTHCDASKTGEGQYSDKAVGKDIQGLKKTFTAPKEQIIPSGKFSLVKHMLSLQNEDNFDKTIFENPLYNKPADIKDFELMVERHRVTDKTDDTIVQSYDLSAKQNIPFHWLGMSVAKRRATIDRVEKERAAESKNTDEPEQDLTAIEERKQTEDEKRTSDSCAEHSMKGNTDKEQVEINKDEEHSIRNDKGNGYKISALQGQTHLSRGYQAMKNLVANRQLVDKTDRQSRSDAGKSVLTNPFDYENKYFQENPRENLGDEDSISTLKVHNSGTSNQSTAHCAGTNVDLTASSNNHKRHGNNVFDSQFSRNDIDVSRQSQFSMQQSDEEAFSKSSLSRPSFTNSKCDIQTHLRSLSESHISTQTVANFYPVSRSLSIPTTAVGTNNRIEPQRLWGSEPSILSKNRPQNNTGTVSTSSVNPMFTSLRQSEKSMNSVNGETKHNKGLITDKEVPFGFLPDKKIDLTMISKNFAQLQKLHHGSLNKNDMKVVFSHHNSLPNVYRNVSKPSQTPDNIESSSLKTTLFGDQQNFSNLRIDNSMEDEIDISEEGVFDAYTMIRSPYRTNSSHLSDGGVKYSHVIETQSINRTSESSPHMCYESNHIGKLHSSVKNSNAGINTGVVNVFEKGRQVHDSQSKCSSHSDESKSGVSIFDILKGHEEKGKEYDSVDTLLGAYI